MREILFRGKRADKDEWIYGTPFQEYSDFWGEWEWKIQTKHPLTNVPFLHLSVEMKTLGQFTGLTDKNGKKVFEGDIIKIPDDYDEFGINAGEVYEVYFAFGGFRLKPKRSNAKGFWLEDDKTVEIIGNIHDNPELLGGAYNENL